MGNGNIVANEMLHAIDNIAMLFQQDKMPHSPICPPLLNVHTVARQQQKQHVQKKEEAKYV